jgi:hypothetical protein
MPQAPAPRQGRHTSRGNRKPLTRPPVEVLASDSSFNGRRPAGHLARRLPCPLEAGPLCFRRRLHDWRAASRVARLPPFQLSPQHLHRQHFNTITPQCQAPCCAYAQPPHMGLLTRSITIPFHLVKVQSKSTTKEQITAGQKSKSASTKRANRAPRNPPCLALDAVCPPGPPL